MKRYVLVMGHPQGILSMAEADLMAEDPLAAVQAFDCESDDPPPKQYISHPPSKTSGFRAHDAEIAHVYELAGEPLKRFYRDDVSTRFLESLGVKVAIIERIW